MTHSPLLALRAWSDFRPYAPTPETEPEAISRDQREAVREARRELRRRGERVTAEAVSELAVLPVSVVRRRLKELAGRRRRVLSVTPGCHIASRPPPG